MSVSGVVDENEAAGVVPVEFLDFLKVEGAHPSIGWLARSVAAVKSSASGPGTSRPGNLEPPLTPLVAGRAHK